MTDDRFPEVATREPATGRNARGEITRGPSETIFVRFEADRRLVRDASGDEIVSDARAFCAPGDLEQGDRITVAGEAWIVRSVAPHRDVDGVLDHVEARL